MRKKPNILFITTDQQQRNTLGCYGNHLIQTPNIDELASDGLKFNRAYCENPICIPSRCTLITGKKSYNHGATLHNSSMSDEVKTIGELLSINGYDTHFIGKPHFKSQQHAGTEESISDWRAGHMDGFTGPYKGFQTCELILGHSNPLLAHYGQWLKENHPNAISSFCSKNLSALDVSCGNGVYYNDIPECAHSSTYVGERTCEYIKKMSKQQKPFYCFASFPDPHWPIMIPKEYMHLYDDLNIPIETEDIRNKEDLLRFPYPVGQMLKKQLPGYDGGGHLVDNREDIPKITRAYWGSVSLIDKNVGKMIQALKDYGLYDDTIIVFTTDHGEYMGSHGMMAKGGLLWEEFIHLPFIIRYGDRLMHGDTNAMLSFIDIVPTLLDLADIENNLFTTDGLSQKDVLVGKKIEMRDHVSIAHISNVSPEITADQQCIVTKDGWKLCYFAGSDKGLLYNLNEDPHEENNLYYNQEHQMRVAQLKLQILDELILNMDLETRKQAATADNYGKHVMYYDVWKKEFDEIM